MNSVAKFHVLTTILAFTVGDYFRCEKTTSFSNDDSDYYFLTMNGETFFRDSACDDCYNFESACALFCTMLFPLLPDSVKVSREVSQGYDYIVFRL